MTTKITERWANLKQLVTGEHKGIRKVFLAVAMTVVLVVSGLATSAAAPSQSDLEAAKKRLLELERDFELVVEEYNATHEQLTQLQFKIGVTAKEVQEIENRMRSKEEAAVAVAVELYKSGTAGTLEAVLSSESLAEMESRLNYLSSSEQAQSQIFESLAADRTELEGKIADLEEARDAAAQKEEQLEALRADIDAKVADQQDEIADLTAAIERAERRAAAREAAAQAATAAAARAPAPFTSSVSSAPVPTVTASNPNAQAAVDAALSQVGKPYQWGASGPDAYDCSGLTMWAWGQAGVSLPHNSGMQYAATGRVAQSDLEPGDLLFFGSPIHHVGMYVGNGQMVEAPYTGLTVRVTAAFRSDYVGAGRPGF
jgi:peptidoglycan DL-endopeptidase CwlO